MYSYQHRYHAGNFADLHKHITLLAILQYLQKKPAAFCVIDAFAGEGFYDLSSTEADLNKEYLTGYGELEKLANNNLLFKDLLSLTNKNLYPGSPAIIESQLREQDRAIFIENHPQAYENLLDNFRITKNLKIYRRDAYEAVNALVPYKESRGVIFLDPSYEVKAEYKNIAELVVSNHKKNATGIYILWYPLLANQSYYKDLASIFDNIDNTKIWHNKWQPFLKNPDLGLYGSGLIVINMPWTVDKVIEQCFCEARI